MMRELVSAVIATHVVSAILSASTALAHGATGTHGATGSAVALSPVATSQESKLPHGQAHSSQSSLPPLPHGVLDATAPPFFADKTGRADATRALQAAFDTGARNGTTVFLPAGR